MDTYLLNDKISVRDDDTVFSPPSKRSCKRSTTFVPIKLHPTLFPKQRLNVADSD